MFLLHSVFILAILSHCIINDIDARKVNPRSNSPLVRRQKREFNSGESQEELPEESEGCGEYVRYCDGQKLVLAQHGADFDSAMRGVSGGWKFSFQNALDSPNNELCDSESQLLAPRAHQLLSQGHITPLVLGSQRAFSLNELNIDALIKNGYLNQYLGKYFLSFLGLLSLLLGQISHSDLQTAGIFQSRNRSYTLEELRAADYVTSRCIPTACGLTAVQARIISLQNLVDVGCKPPEKPHEAHRALLEANYINPGSKFLTVLSFSAMSARYLGRSYLRRIGVYPLPNADRCLNTSVEEFQRINSPRVGGEHCLNGLVNAGYFTPQYYLITRVGVVAYNHQYYNQQMLRGMNLWPCRPNVRPSQLLSHGYITPGGSLTELGAQLFRLGYLTTKLLVSVGVFVAPYYSLHQDAMNYRSHIVDREMGLAQTGMGLSEYQRYGAAVPTGFAEARPVAAVSQGFGDARQAVAHQASLVESGLAGAEGLPMAATQQGDDGFAAGQGESQVLSMPLPASQ